MLVLCNEVPPYVNSLLSGLLTGILSLLGAVVGFWMTRQNTKTQIKANSISSQRIEWINQLKNLVSDYMDACRSVLIANVSKRDKEYFDSLLTSVLCSKNKLVLHINSISDIADRIVIDIINDTCGDIEKYITACLDKTTEVQKFKECIMLDFKCMVFIIPIYTKFEWEKIKSETSNKKICLKFEDFIIMYNNDDAAFNHLLPDLCSSYCKEIDRIYNLINDAIKNKTRKKLKSGIFKNSSYSKKIIKNYLFPKVDAKFKRGYGITWYVVAYNSRGKKKREEFYTKCENNMIE